MGVGIRSWWHVPRFKERPYVALSTFINQGDGSSLLFSFTSLRNPIILGYDGILTASAPSSTDLHTSSSLRSEGAEDVL